MTGPLILDSEAFSALAGLRSRSQIEVRAEMRAAERLGSDVIVRTVILAEVYRGPRHNPMLDACFSRETGIRCRDTDRSLAHLVRGVLSTVGAASEFLADPMS